MLSLPFDLERSTTIDKPASEVFACIADFHTWKQWSPWVCMEPDCAIRIEGSASSVGHKQEWVGKRIGEGINTIQSLETGKSIHYDLQFLKPWKSRSKVAFLLEEENGSTKVTWTMRGTVPLFLFFLRKMMSVFVGMDYERGLLMLKEYLESGEVLTRTELKGDSEQTTFRYMGLRRSCSIQEISKTMEEDFAKMESLAAKGELPRPDFALSFYHKWDPANNACEYTTAYAYKKTIQAMTPKGFVEGRVEPHKALQVNHVGAYRHLGNAWATLMGAQRSLKKRPLKGIPMYEIYKTPPKSVPEKELLTELYLPVR